MRAGPRHVYRRATADEKAMHHLVCRVVIDNVMAEAPWSAMPISSSLRLEPDAFSRHDIQARGVTSRSDIRNSLKEDPRSNVIMCTLHAGREIEAPKYILRPRRRATGMVDRVVGWSMALARQPVLRVELASCARPSPDLTAGLLSDGQTEIEGCRKARQGSQSAAAQGANLKPEFLATFSASNEPSSTVFAPVLKMTRAKQPHICSRAVTMEIR